MYLCKERGIGRRERRVGHFTFTETNNTRILTAEGHMPAKVHVKKITKNAHQTKGLKPVEKPVKKTAKKITLNDLEKVQKEAWAAIRETQQAHKETEKAIKETQKT
jgi:hypothetical protein